MFKILGLHKFRTFPNLDSYFACSNFDLQRTLRRRCFFDSVVFSDSFAIDYPKLSYHNLNMSGYRSNTTLTRIPYLKMDSLWTWVLYFDHFIFTIFSCFLSMINSHPIKYRENFIVLTREILSYRISIIF